MPAYKPIQKSKTTVVTNKQRKQAPAGIYVGENGYIQNAGYTIKPIPALEHGAIEGPKAIVLHRTEGKTLDSALTSAKENREGVHFYIDKDGTVTQTASLLKQTAHVGRKIRSKSYDQGTCSDEEKKIINGYHGSLGLINAHEREKAYPARYPLNRDSVGIETVAYNAGSDEHPVWDPLTSEQAAAISKLVGILKEAYGLTDKDVYQHDWISYKALDEGKGLYPHTAHDGFVHPPN